MKENVRQKRQEHTRGPWSASSMIMTAKDWRELNSGKSPLTIVRRAEDVIAIVWAEVDDEEVQNSLLIADAPAMKLALELIRQGRARIEASTGEFCFKGLRVSIGNNWSGVLDVLGWDRAAEASKEAA